MRAARWSDNDHYLGPFTFALSDSYHNDRAETMTTTSRTVCPSRISMIRI